MDYIKISFWISFCILFYVFIGYAIIIYLLIICKRLVLKKTIDLNNYFEPAVTLIITCCNKADILATQIANCKHLNYPSDKLKLVFIIDEPSDKSERILNAWLDIKVLYQSGREGKTAAENRVMKFIDTPFIIFFDANTNLNRDAIVNIVKHFANESVGCVSGEKKIFNNVSDNTGAAREGIYLKYASLLKCLDCELNTAVGAAGELVAFRTELYTDLPEDTILNEFMQSMLIAIAGYKIVYEPNAFAVETASVSIQKKLKRKVHICSGGWQSIIRLQNKFTLHKQPLLFFQYISHRVLRWTITPFLLIAIFILNLKMDLFVNGIYQVFMVAQFLFYTIAMAGLLLKNNNLKYKQIFMPYYFCVMNYAVLAGLVKFISGIQNILWDKIRRKVVVFEKV